MRKTVTTPEFWSALIGQVVSMIVLFGGLNPEQGEAMSGALQAIAGGVLSILTIMGFIKAQTLRKNMAVRLLSLKADLATYDDEAHPALKAASTNILSELDELRAEL